MTEIKTCDEMAVIAMKTHSDAQADLKLMKLAVKRSREQDHQHREERLRLMRDNRPSRLY